MTQMRTALFLVALLLLCSYDLMAQGEVFARRDTIAPAAIEPAGFGEIVAGVDFDGDGKTEIYAVNTNWNDTQNELIPRIYKYEWNGTTWDSVWSATLNVPKQNTWPALTAADLDKDGKMEIVWGPANFTDPVTNPNPVRIAVFEAKGDGSDVMGISDGNNFRPNAQWTITSIANEDLRPFRWVAADVDHDDTTEVVFCDRASIYRVGVISVSNIPDNGDSSETWRLEFSGKGQTIASNTIYDLAVVDSTIYLFHNVAAGTVTPVRFRNGAYSIGAALNNVVPSGAWKSAQVVDLDKDGTKEVVIGSMATGSANVYLLQVQGDTLARTAIANLALGSNGRIYGGAMGDIDHDGYMDFVYGSRGAAKEGTISAVKYLGNSITSPSNYKAEVADQLYRPNENGRYDILGFVNVDADADSEIVYSNGIGNRFPLVTLDRVPTKSYFTTISGARIDANGDAVPDRSDTVQVVGIVNSYNYTATSFRMSYLIQDDSAGVAITKASMPGGGPAFKIGEKVLVTGRVGQFNGVTQLDVADTLNIVRLGTGFPLTAVNVTLDNFYQSPETYEARYIQVRGLAKTATSLAWPLADADANMTVWDGFNTITLRIDKDSEIDGQPEPVWPVNVKGVITQYDNTAPFTAGYQIQPNVYGDFTANVAVSPNRHFALLQPANGSSIILNSTTDTVRFVWAKAVDLNGDTLTYQWMPVGFSNVAAGRDTSMIRTGAQMLTYLGTKDTVVLKWTVFAKDAGPAMSSLDTLSVTVIRGSILGVEEIETLPTVFALEQNYPNPFNPTTTIRFSLPTQAYVSVKIYDVLGREVATLLDQNRNAGVCEVVWNGDNNTGSKVASGMYIYRMEARPANGSSPFVSVKKMMLLK